VEVKEDVDEDTSLIVGWSLVDGRAMSEVQMSRTSTIDLKVTNFIPTDLSFNHYKRLASLISLNILSPDKSVPCQNARNTNRRENEILY